MLLQERQSHYLSLMLWRENSKFFYRRHGMNPIQVASIELPTFFSSWYVGAVSERKAEKILSQQGVVGGFLVRDSLLPDADYVLSVK